MIASAARCLMIPVFQCWDESQMQWSTTCTSVKASHAQTSTQPEVGPNDSSFGTSSRRQAAVEGDSLSEISAPGPNAQNCVLSRSWHATFMRAQGQPVGKEEDSETIDECGPLPLPKSARVVSRRQHHRLHTLVDHLMCRDGRKNRSRREQLCGHSQLRNDQTALGTFLKFVQERALPLVEDVEIDGALVAYSNDCFVQGVEHYHVSQLLAIRFGSRKHPKLHRCLTVR